MKGRFLCILFVLQIVSWVSVAKRPFPPADGMSLPGTGTEESPEPKSSPPYTTKSEKGVIVTEGRSAEIKGRAYEKAAASIGSKIGSTPPRCEHKCYGCSPCEAIQVPSTGKRTSHFGIQYANYEPESWKCKCGPFFYTP